VDSASEHRGYQEYASVADGTFRRYRPVIVLRPGCQQCVLQPCSQDARSLAYCCPCALNRIAWQGVIRPGLLSLRERYRLRGRELAEDGLVLAEQLDAAREGNAERQEELACLRRQVRPCCHPTVPLWRQARACVLQL